MVRSGIGLSVMLISLAGSAAAIALPADESTSHQCEIRTTETPAGLRVESVVRGEPGTSGSYEFVLSRSGSGGLSDVNQGGEYTIPESGEMTVSVSEFNHRRRDDFDAALTVSGPNGSTSCEESEP